MVEPETLDRESRHANLTSMDTRWAFDGVPFARNAVGPSPGVDYRLGVLWRPGALTLIHHFEASILPLDSSDDSSRRSLVEQVELDGVRGVDLCPYRTVCTVCART